jgi:hypothetical protein
MTTIRALAIFVNHGKLAEPGTDWGFGGVNMELPI